MPASPCQEGAPFPLGSSWDEESQSYNFALYSKHAQRVMLLFFGADDFHAPLEQFELDYLVNKSGPIWHCRIPNPVGASYYAYRVEGPAPGPGFSQHDFDFEKLLLDPYATHVFFPPEFSREAAMLPGSNIGQAPLAVLNCDCRDNPKPVSRPLHREAELIIYEMHVRGFTCDESSRLSAEKRGTYAGAIEKIPHLMELGVTAVELMPVFQYDPDEGNYWGYMPLNFFAPHHEYAVEPDLCHQFAEFRNMVDAFHAAGIEVILDVVYNHTTEATHEGPTYSFRGIDSSTYYMMTGDSEEPYANFSGAGNTLHTQNRAVRQLIIDSLRHWVTHGGVDGFRFDLASIFTRSSDGAVSTHEPPIFGEITSQPELSQIHLIAEPWDLGGLYQLGRRFPGTLWMQWNGAYRDTLQKSVRGDDSMISDLMTRLYGSADLFPDSRMEAYHPYQSINFITSHDGFTLLDLVSYNDKDNWANGHENQDGATDFSWDCEGDTNLRRQQIRNFICLLMLSNGVPMFRMGDEFLNSQNGNSNPYNQDNKTSWLNWSELEKNEDIFRFFKFMIQFRKANPSISRSRFWRDDIHWYGTAHVVDFSPKSRQLAYCLHGETANDSDLYVMINLGPDDLDFGIHEGQPTDWKQVINTAEPDLSEFLVSSPFFNVSSRSIVVLERISSMYKLRAIHKTSSSHVNPRRANLEHPMSD